MYIRALAVIFPMEVKIDEETIKATGIAIATLPFLKYVFQKLVAKTAIEDTATATSEAQASTIVSLNAENVRLRELLEKKESEIETLIGKNSELRNSNLELTETLTKITTNIVLRKAANRP